MRILRIPLIILALVGLIAVSGCGGGDSTTTESTSSEALSVDEYTTQAQQVLVDIQTKFASFQTQLTALRVKSQLLGQSKNSEESAQILDQADTEIQSAIDDFAAITPPEEAQEGHDQILAALEDLSGKFTDVNEAVGSGDKTAIKDAAAALQAAAPDLATQIQEGTQSLTDAGIDLSGGSATTPSGG